MLLVDNGKRTEHPISISVPFYTDLLFITMFTLQSKLLDLYKLIMRLLSIILDSAFDIWWNAGKLSSLFRNNGRSRSSWKLFRI